MHCKPILFLSLAIFTFSYSTFSEGSCAFWNPERNDWSSEGCEKIDEGGDFIQCTCSHLTNFGVILDVNGNLEGEVSFSMFIFKVKGRNA